MNRRSRTIDFNAIEKYPIAIARDAWVEMPGLVAGWQFERVRFDFHIAAAHCVAADGSGVGIDFATAREPEFITQMILFWSARREQAHAF
jgi:hypothetical protein